MKFYTGIWSIALLFFFYVKIKPGFQKVIYPAWKKCNCQKDKTNQGKKKRNQYKDIAQLHKAKQINLYHFCVRYLWRSFSTDNKVYNFRELGHAIMADRSSRIRLDLLLHYCSLVLLPGARIKSEIVETDCKITKKIAICEYINIQ